MNAERWSWNESYVAEPVTLAVNIDTSHALTVVLSLRATCEKADIQGWGRGEEVVSAGLSWWLEDSLDGTTWYPLATGGLYPKNETRIVRLSDPLGSRIRLRMKPQVVRTFWDSDGSFSRRELIEIFAQQVPVRDAAASIIVRSFVPS